MWLIARDGPDFMAPGPLHIHASCETLPHCNHTNFVSSSLFPLWTFRWRLGQSSPRWKRTPQQNQMCSKKEHLVKNQQPYLALKNQSPIISGNHWLNTDWKLVDFFFPIILTKKLVMHMKPFMCITLSFFHTAFDLQDTGPDFTCYTHRHSLWMSQETSDLYLVKKFEIESWNWSTLKPMQTHKTSIIIQVLIVHNKLKLLVRERMRSR